MSSPAPPPSLHEQAAGQAPPALKAAWLMGRDPVLRQQVWGVLFSSATYLLYGLITVVQVQFGFLSSRQAWILFAGSVVLNAVFYALVRSGWSARTADPGLARTQLLLGVGVMFIAYPFLGPAAPTMVIVMSSHIVYSMFGMPPRAVWRLVAASLAALAVTMVACHLAMPERYPVGTQLSAFLYALLVVPLIALLAGRVSAMTLRLQRQQEQLQQALAEVQALANRDELTRVHNRHHMTGLLGEQRRAHQQARKAMSLALIDIDHFKRINDLQGHNIGDQVLRRFAALAQEQLRLTDLVARWGGEEFLIGLPHTTRSDALEVIERLQRALADPARAGMPAGLAVSFSAGVTEMRDDETLEAAIERADQAMYAAKRSGRARCVPG
jgi:diguanylate cyclase (GGDEF)-like protein